MPPFGRLLISLTALALCSCVAPKGGRLDAPNPVKPAIAPVPKPIKVTPAISPVPVSAPPTSADTAFSAGVVAGPGLDSLNIGQEQSKRALAAFRISCPSVIKRKDVSGLTQPDDWKPACSAARDWPDSDAPGFFARYFETVQVGTGKAFATGYFEPEILGSRVKQSGFEVPIYARPKDIIEVDLGAFSDALKGKKIRGRVDKNTLVPYYDRTAIDKGALDGRELEIAWAADEVEFFFLQIQGSGRLRLPDGSIMRIGFDGQNGRDYTGIGKLLIDRGDLPKGQGSMQGIMAWLRANPEKGIAVMRENKSFVFFRELKGAGPLGALGLPVTGKVSVAADPAYIPLGAPVFLSMDRPEVAGIWVAQDTGGAIKGANRFDTFWGAGDDARRIAGGMSGRGTALLLLPIGTVDRINSDKAPIEH